MSRPVRICTISLNSLVDSARRATKEEMFQEIEEKLALGALDKPDLFLLPEVCLLNGTPESWVDPNNIEEEGNSTYQRLGEAARAHNAYIVAPLLTREEGLIYNSAVVFDRQGEPVYTYHKAHPTGGELKQRGITAGTLSPRPWKAPFGRVGIAICYDLKFQPLFKHYYTADAVHRPGIELLLFPSYFPGGLRLQSMAYMYSFYVVSSHKQGYESVFLNNLGFEVARADMFAQALTHEFELDSVVVPYLENEEAVRAAKRKYGPAVETEIHRPEGDMIVRYRGTETTVPDMMREFGIVTRAEAFHNQHLV
jgi:predicted amidohydrolase